MRNSQSTAASRNIASLTLRRSAIMSWASASSMTSLLCCLSDTNRRITLLMPVKRIGILTGGGDCPGLNPTIKGVVTRAADHGIEVLGLQNGWKSLVGDTPLYEPLSVDQVRPIIKEGGTILHTSRTNAYDKKHPEYLSNLVRNFDKLGIDAI